MWDKIMRMKLVICILHLFLYHARTFAFIIPQQQHLQQRHNRGRPTLFQLTSPTTTASTTTTTTTTTASKQVTTETASNIDNNNNNNNNDNNDNDNNNNNILLLLPERSPNSLTNNEQEFRDKCAVFASYTEEDIGLISNPRLRTLYEGVAAGATEPTVYRAFEVLYEDHTSIRYAGRIIYGALAQKMNEARTWKADCIQRLLPVLGGVEPDIQACLRAYRVLSGQKRYLTPKQFMTSGAAAQIVQIVNDSNSNSNNAISVDELTSQFTKSRKGRIEIDHLVSVLQTVMRSSSTTTTTAADAGSKDQHNVVEVLDTIAKSVIENEQNSSNKKQKETKTALRFDEMVEQVQQWEEYYNDYDDNNNNNNNNNKPTSSLSTKKGDGDRMYDVLQGCFVGAKNPAVVGALKIVYIDYRLLQIAGQMIFKLMKALVNMKKKKKNMMKKSE